ncbi:P-loop NTPase fold protein [Rhodoplanes sp. TEM]|uniref:P-loop NTPase fold protein n=1 Tax=Rhodoplanes tepidamans TaxID=200616 RepID=A0ABT5JKW4_RHOTP|nr:MULTISPECIES: Qat anti-phage system ATPase QatA [Rhodoplanes]MDC7789933.1 P-loop NTPase fold protein [Rhodoplanes tepidamans]MDC7987854.1 P-loop NTPase fold protein [Rhodoplanes sp. TEM]MDQ0357853.1 putative KAP-like P-loop ATPase [Rhodoplanes tepidamans]
MILTDNETKIDLLNNEAIAKTIIELLCERPERAVTIGVHGDWGAGKSSILEMIESGLAFKKDILCIKFNGWRFQGFEDAKIALIEGIVTGLIEKRPLLTKTGLAIKDIFQRINWLKIARHGGGFAFTALSGMPTVDQVGAVVGNLKEIYADPSKLATKDYYDKAMDSVQGLLKPGAPKNIPEEVEEFRKSFDELLKQADVQQLIVLIDDLDRCLPDTAIETLEAVRLFVFTAKTAFVVAADEAMIEYSVRKHFPELPDTTGPRDYARNYLEKLIQIPFRIPALGEMETRIYVTLLLIGAQLGENDPAYTTLVDAARELLKRPWQSAGLDAQTVKTALGEQAGAVQNALILSDQIGPILASGTQGNPRQIKRFLNGLLLRHQTALARGFGDEVKLPVLAKLMLAERFLSRLFDQIASAAARSQNGRCKDLAALEAAALEEASAASKPKRAGPRVSVVADDKTIAARESEDSAILTEWKAADAIRAWARLSPPLAELDLRPYLFVTKDRKDYFGAASVLGRLAAVVEKLLGPKLAVQALDGELKQLVPAEAAQVFEELRGRVMGGDSFDTAPPGIDGLAVLVRAHPTLQINLLDLLEALPVDRCGPWPASGWEAVIKDTEAVLRFEKLLRRWSSSQSAFLKATADAALRTRTGRR